MFEYCVIKLKFKLLRLDFANYNFNFMRFTGFPKGFLVIQYKPWAYPISNIKNCFLKNLLPPCSIYILFKLNSEFFCLLVNITAFCGFFIKTNWFRLKFNFFVFNKFSKIKKLFTAFSNLTPWCKKRLFNFWPTTVWMINWIFCHTSNPYTMFF